MTGPAAPGAQGWLQLNRAHFPVTALGPGLRIALWFQGCALRCPGCVSRDTWTQGTDRVALHDVFSLLETWLPQADGLTVSGGEPFEQPEALAAVMTWWRVRHSGDVLVYSGYSWEYLRAMHADLISLADAVISDPYDRDAPQSLPWRGSDNQRLHLLSPLARLRFAEPAHAAALDVCVDGDRVWLAGIPRPGDLPRLRERLADLGVSATTSEQHPQSVEVLA